MPRSCPLIYHLIKVQIKINLTPKLVKLFQVAGWGLTAANGVSSQSLQVVEMPFINEKTCVNDLPQSFRPYITGDKFCAGYTNGKLHVAGQVEIY